MLRSLLVLIALTFINTAYASVNCAGASSDIFKDVDLNLEELYDSEFLEEGLSFYEYPYFWINVAGDQYDVSIGAGSFDMKLSCEKDGFVLTEVEGSTVIKNIKVEAGKIVSAEVFTSDSKDSKVA